MRPYALLCLATASALAARSTTASRVVPQHQAFPDGAYSALADDCGGPTYERAMLPIDGWDATTAPPAIFTRTVAASSCLMIVPTMHYSWIPKSANGFSVVDLKNMYTSAVWRAPSTAKNAYPTLQLLPGEDAVIATYPTTSTSDTGCSAVAKVGFNATSTSTVWSHTMCAGGPTNGGSSYLVTPRDRWGLRWVMHIVQQSNGVDTTALLVEVIDASTNSGTVISRFTEMPSPSSQCDRFRGITRGDDGQLLFIGVVCGGHTADVPYTVSDAAGLTPLTTFLNGAGLPVLGYGVNPVVFCDASGGCTGTDVYSGAAKWSHRVPYLANTEPFPAAFRGATVAQKYVRVGLSTTYVVMNYAYHAGASVVSRVALVDAATGQVTRARPDVVVNGTDYADLQPVFYRPGVVLQMVGETWFALDATQGLKIVASGMYPTYNGCEPHPDVAGRSVHLTSLTNGGGYAVHVCGSNPERGYTLIVGNGTAQ